MVVSGKKNRGYYRMMHLSLLFCEFVGLTVSATLAASVKASLTPRFRIAEHSASNVRLRLAHVSPVTRGTTVPRYLNAPILLATSRPSLYVIADRPRDADPSSSFSSLTSSLKSHLRATSTSFAPAQCSAISLIHFDSTFSRESLVSTYSRGLLAFL